MSNQTVSIEAPAGEFFKNESVEQDEWIDTPPKSRRIKKRIQQHVRQLFVLLERRRDSRSFDEVEKATIPLIFALGRLFLAYLLAWRHEHAERACRRVRHKCYETGEAQARMLGTRFGRVRYWRTYLLAWKRTYYNDRKPDRWGEVCGYHWFITIEEHCCLRSCFT